MQIKNIVFAVLAATAVATTASEQPNALRRDVTADAVQEATVDMAGTTVRIADKVIDELANKVIDGLANLDDIASSTIDIAQDLFDLNVAKIVPDGIVSGNNSYRPTADLHGNILTIQIETCPAFCSGSLNIHQFL